MEDFNATLAVDPDYVKAYLFRGYIDVQAGRNELALEDFTTAIQMAPEDPAAYVLRGFAWGAHGHV